MISIQVLGTSFLLVLVDASATYGHLLSRILYVIKNFLKVGVIIHGRAHLHRLSVLPMLL